MALNYDPKRVIVTLGAVIASGFADGTFVTITADEDNFSTYKGADGTVSRSNLNNTTATLKLELAQTSPTNSFLNKMMHLDKTTSAGSFPVKIKDLSGMSDHTGASCWIKKQPEQKFGKEVDTIAWEIQMTGYIGNIGGAIPTGA